MTPRLSHWNSAASASGAGGASVPSGANGAAAPNLYVVYKTEKPEEGITLSRADGSMIRHISLPRNTVYTAVRNDMIYAFEKNLKCKVYDLEGKLTDVFESNPVNSGTVVIHDLDAEGKKLLYSKVEGSDFLASDWVYVRELASGSAESFTQRFHGEPFRFLQDGTVLYPKFDISDGYQDFDYPYEIQEIIRFDLQKRETVRTYRIFNDVTLFKNCRIGMNQDRSMFFPEMDSCNMEDGGQGRVIYAFDTDGDDYCIDHVSCASREKGQVVILPEGRFIGGCGRKELWFRDIRDDSWREKFLEESEDCRLLFRPDGLEFYVQKKSDAGGTWKRYRVEFEYD